MNLRTRIKICGITRPEDAELATKLGADAIGLVFYPQSARFVSVAKASAIIERIYPFVTVVGLFVNARPQDIKKIVKAVKLDMLQFHGDETKEDCEKLGMPYMKALRIRNEETTKNIARMINAYDSANAILLDSYQEGAPGGTGHRFDWAKIPKKPGKPIVLAGGLKPENVAEAIRIVKPYGVDISSGVEKSKGIKDPHKLKAFIHEVNHVN